MLTGLYTMFEREMHASLGSKRICFGRLNELGHDPIRKHYKVHTHLYQHHKGGQFPRVTRFQLGVAGGCVQCVTRRPLNQTKS